MMPVIILSGTAVLFAAAVLILRHRNPADTELLNARLAAYHAGTDRQGVPGPLTVINVQLGAHLHLEQGADTGGGIRQAPVQGAVIARRDQRPGQ